MIRMAGVAHFTAGAARQAVSQAGGLCRRRDRTVCGQELLWPGRMSVTATVMSSDTAFCTINMTQLSAGSAATPEPAVAPLSAACHAALSRHGAPLHVPIFVAKLCNSQCIPITSVDRADQRCGIIRSA